MAVASFLAWLGVLWLGDWADQTARPWANIIGLQVGHLPRFFSTVMLLAAGQLAFINLWYRSRSRKDFNGSYKVWFHTAVGWLTVCAFTATGSHWTLADVLLGGRPIAVWNGRLMLWLIPGAIVVTALYRLLLREMRDCRLSLWLLRLSAGASAADAAVLLLGPFAFSARWQLLLEVGGSTAWHLLLALSMLLHARHVIHVSNEPPQSPLPSWKWRLPKLGWMLQVFRVRRAKSLTSPDGPATGKAKRSSSSARDRSTSKERSAARLRPVAKAVQSQEEAEETSAVGDEGEERPVHSQSGGSQGIHQTPTTGGAKSSLPSGATAAGVTQRVDPPQSASPRPHLTPSPPRRSTDPAEDDADEDDETFEHRPLSKQERRRLRKLQQHSSPRSTAR